MFTSKRFAAVFVLPALFACSSSKGSAADKPVVQQSMADMSAPVTIPAGALFTAADVHFMQGMIAHHAQAIYMSRMAKEHGANPRVLKFAIKIDQSQISEIRLMQDWLLRNGQTAPDTSSWRHMQMPGMLTAQQLRDLDAAKGADFDREFLTLMIQHHEGAIRMVKDLFATPGAGQESEIFSFASDVDADQRMEIDRMSDMLKELHK